jgi:hypothetical protein
MHASSPTTPEEKSCAGLSHLALAHRFLKDLFPDDGSQEIRPTPRLAESTLARRSPQPPGRTSLWVRARLIFVLLLLLFLKNQF